MKKAQNYLKQIPRDYLNRRHVCYSEASLDKLFGDRTTFTAEDILEQDISDVQKLWTLLNKEVFDPEVLHYMAIEFAKRVVTVYTCEFPDNPYPEEAMQVYQAWLEGKTDDRSKASARAAVEATCLKDTNQPADGFSYAAARAVWAAGILTSKGEV